MIVVTGAAGFIGSAIVWSLNRLGETDVICVDQFDSTDKWKNMAPLVYRDYRESDLFLEQVLSGTLEKNVSAIFHMGACSDTTETDGRFMVKNNFEYSKHLARYAVGEGIRFIYASSAATYGDGSRGYSDDESRLHELRPLNMYAMSKQMFDLWARENGMLDKIVGLKYFNVFGPNEYHKGDMRSLVCKGHAQIKETGALRLFKSYRQEYADGAQERDFIYVKDAVKATLHFYRASKRCGIFNVGTGRARNWNDLASALFKAMDVPENIKYVDMPETLRDRYQYHTEANVGKLRQAGFDGEFTSLEDAVTDYVKRYLSWGSHLEP